jgi:hypothetical protein
MAQRRVTRHHSFTITGDDGRTYHISGNVEYGIGESRESHIEQVLFTNLALDDGTPVERIKQGEYRVQGTEQILRADDFDIP